MIGTTAVLAAGAAFYFISASRKKKKSLKKAKSLIFNSSVHELPLPATSESGPKIPVKADSVVSAGIKSTDKQTPTTISSSNLEEYLEGITDENIAEMSDAERVQLASNARNLGNNYFNVKNYSRAIEIYSVSIKISPESDFDVSLSYSNRAACYLVQGLHQETIADCSKAIKLNSKYLKAFERRSKSYVVLGNLNDAAFDVMVCCILEDFKNQSSTKRLDELLKNSAEKIADDMQSNRSPSLPSNYAINEMLSSFPFPFKGVVLSSLPSNLQESIQKLNKKQFKAAFEGFLSSIKSLSEDDGPLLSVAHEFCGTFFLFEGSLNEAKSSLEKALQANPKNTNAIIKMAIWHLENSNFSEMMTAINEAISIDPSDPTGYFFRAEFNAMSNEFESANQDYEKAIQLKKDYIPAIVHQVRCFSGNDDIKNASDTLQRHLKKFPLNADLLNCYGELLVFLGDTDEAFKKFDAAIAQSVDNPNFYLNKALLYISADNNLEKAHEMLNAAIQKDPKFEAAHLQMGNLLLSKGAHDEAFKHFDIAADNARNREELVNILALRESNRIQLRIANIYPELADKFMNAMMAMQAQSMAEASA